MRLLSLTQSHDRRGFVCVASVRVSSQCVFRITVLRCLVILLPDLVLDLRLPVGGSVWSRVVVPPQYWGATKKFSLEPCKKFFRLWFGKHVSSNVRHLLLVMQKTLLFGNGTFRPIKHDCWLSCMTYAHSTWRYILFIFMNPTTAITTSATTRYVHQTCQREQLRHDRTRDRYGTQSCQKLALQPLESQPRAYLRRPPRA